MKQRLQFRELSSHVIVHGPGKLLGKIDPENGIQTPANPLESSADTMRDGHPSIVVFQLEREPLRIPAKLNADSEDAERGFRASRTRLGAQRRSVAVS